MDQDKIKRLTHEYATGKVGRRGFLQAAAAIGLSVTAANTLLSTTAKAANKGGRLRVGVGHGSTTDSLDPQTFENGFTTNMGYALRNNLTEIDKNGKLVGELAESWDASPDAKVWTFNLRKGVEFHNGKTMTAADVIASINHHRGEDSKSAAKSIVDPISDIKSDGKDKVVITLKDGNADLPFLVSDYHITIMPEKDGGVDWQSGVGTGGYMLDNYEPGVRFIGKKFANYFKEDAAHVDEYELLTIGDVNAKQNALTTGEVDVIDRPDLKTIKLFKRRGGVDIEQATGTRHYTIPMRTDTAPFDDNNIRMALKHAFDRQTLVDTILQGYGAVGNDHPIAPSNPYYAADIPQRVQDTDKAKWYLKQAGLSSLTVDLSAADAAFTGAVDAAVIMKEHAAKAGITINVVREPNDGYWSNVWMKKAWCMCYWGGRPTEDWMFTTAYAADANWNDTFWKNDRFNELLLAARRELNETERAAMYKEMQMLVRDDGGVVVPMFADYVWAKSKKVEHGPVASNWDLDGSKISERWWFA